MDQHKSPRRPRVWEDTNHASLCALGVHLQRTGVLSTLAQGCTIQQKTLHYTPVQKVTMLFGALLTGITSLSQTEALRADRALQTAFGLPGWAEQSVVSGTLSAATEQIQRRFGRALHHDVAAAILTVDLDLSPSPASQQVDRGVGAQLSRDGTHRLRKQAHPGQCPTAVR